MYYFIVNPNARCGQGYKIWKKLERLLVHDNVEYEAYLSKAPGEARGIAKKLTEYCKEPRVIVAVGGDGTMNEVLDGLVFGVPLTLGYIPAGTGSDLARSLRLPKNPVKCLKKILYPKYHKLMDYGVLTFGSEEVSHRRFMISAGIGLDAAVCHNLLYSRVKLILNKAHLGRLTYMVIGCRQLILARPVKGYLILDGVKKVEFNHIYFVSAHIHPYEGGGFKFAPKADYTDGKLSVYVASHASKRKLLSVLAAALTGRQARFKGTRCYECREAHVHTDQPMAVHVDGESCFCQNDVQIQCIERKLRMIV